MSTYPDTSSSPSLVRTDGVALSQLITAANKVTITQGVDDTHKFWASGQRTIASTYREILNISFGSKRTINYLDFQVSRFPVVVTAEYLDDAGLWHPITYESSAQAAKVSARMVVSKSVPATVDSARATAHPQHFGSSHWQTEKWKINPVSTSSIRFILVRNHSGVPPKDHQHRSKHDRDDIIAARAVAYSLAVKDLRIGYQVITKDDIPTPVPEKPYWATTKDILGSQVVYSTYTQPASASIDGDDSTFWKSEPQPFPFAVVNLFLDVRAADGSVPVIDRFWVNPVTAGVHCNVYHCDQSVTGDFSGLSEPIPSQFSTLVGNPEVARDPSTNAPLYVALGPVSQTGIEISNVFNRMRYDQPWWVGIDAVALVGGDDLGPHPMVSLGSTQIRQNNGDIEVLSQDGTKASITLDPNLHRLNGEYRVAVSYHPPDPASGRSAYFRLAYLISGYPLVWTEASLPNFLSDENSPIKIGLSPDPSNTDVPAMGVLGLSVKSESLDDITEQWFFDSGADYSKDPINSHTDQGNSQNAHVRMHPSFYTPSNIFAVVGGAEEDFGSMVWTPVIRDYSLKQGFLHLSPIQAKYWKFEMTSLIPQIYENFVTIDREVLVFPRDIVALHDQMTGQNETSAPSGVQTNTNRSQYVSYSDALQAVQSPPVAADATSVMVVSDPTQAAEVAKTGWIWNYSPWHVGSSAPQFVGTCQHRYESLRVKHSTKVAFFAGIREITPFRTDYTFDDDTPEYVEHMLDGQFIDSMPGMEMIDGGVRSIGSRGSVESKTLNSYESVRGVQFATQETDAVQVLDDPDFALPTLSLWNSYGDARVSLIDKNDVQINRGWFPNSYDALSLKYPTYSAIDSGLYFLLEGNNNIVTGSADGGLSSQPYTPSGAGSVSALVKISSAAQLMAPVWVEIVSATTGQVVASAQRTLHAGETAEVSVGYTPGSLLTHYTYADVENLLNVTSSNLLTGDSTTFAESTGGWVPAVNCSVSNTPDPNVRGSYSLAVTATASGDASSSSQSFAVTTGTTYQAVVKGEAVTLARNIEVSCTWLDSGSNILSTITSTGTPDTLTGWTQVTVSGAAPAGAIFAYLTVSVLGAGAGEVHNFSSPGLTATGLPVATYADLEKYTYLGLETYKSLDNLYVRVRQQGGFRDTFHIHRIGLYDSPIAWYFSNDDGANWWQAIDVRNNPHSVMLFPENLASPGTMLRWMAKCYRTNALISSLYIRPWYGTRSRTAEPYYGLDALGPNRSLHDVLPPLHLHPMWLEHNNSIEMIYGLQRGPLTSDGNPEGLVLGDALVIE